VSIARILFIMGMALVGTCGRVEIAAAHAGGASYVEFTHREDEWSAQLDLPLADVAEEFQLDTDGDGALRWGEVLDATDRLQAVYATRLVLRSPGGNCAATAGPPLELVRRATGVHLRLHQRFGSAVGCGGDGVLDVERWLAALPEHGVYVTRSGAPDAVTLLTGSVHSMPLGSDIAKPQAASSQFLLLGIEHLLTGYDHLVFLGLLLLGIARTRAMRGANARSTLLEAAGIVSAFTVAHSLTLALAATGVVSLPAAPVEAAIAASIVITAVAVVCGIRFALGWRVAFAFGLVHGLGFANLLGELLTGVSLAWPLAFFNLGLEVAQLGIVLATLPVIVWLARRPELAARAVPAVAAVFGVCGGLWLVERL
jgi:hypothetical protein